eukprot:Gregarina_sp_Pseudo_9__2025@NODE_2402_length_1006_cov_5_642192_g2209_i0_p1_GENE_NODE_2402_length_1006_cov_5_642192_g2209_i0NODE_2402_length_1006_cov_5_642192_g2209_i0_p1_ORF_typecomplete_len325_score24_44_NODE_2402_length_1006_cov_5_642192_g2209_i0271001
MLPLLLPSLKDDLPSWSECGPVVANCFGLDSKEYWSERLESVKNEVTDIFMEDEMDDAADAEARVRWEYSRSVSPRLTMIAYPVDLPLINIWIGGRAPLPENFHFVNLFMQCIQPREVKANFKDLVENNKFFLRRQCYEDLKELAWDLNEANAQEAAKLLMSPGVPPVRILKSMLGTDQMTNGERECYAYKKGVQGAHSSVGLNTLEALIQEVDLCRRGWLKLGSAPKKGKTMPEKREDEFRKFLFAESFSSKLEAQKESYRNCSPLPPLLTCSCLPDDPASTARGTKEWSLLAAPPLFAQRSQNSTNAVEQESVPTIALSSKH